MAAVERISDVRLSEPDSGPGSQVNVLEMFEVIPSLLGQGPASCSLCGIGTDSRSLFPPLVFIGVAVLAVIGECGEVGGACTVVNIQVPYLFLSLVGFPDLSSSGF